MVLTFLELLKRTKLHITEDPDRGSLPDSWFAYFVDDAHTTVCNYIMGLRDDFFVTYKDITLNGALTYDIARGVDRIVHVEDITAGATYPYDTHPIRFEDRFYYLSNLSGTQTGYTLDKGKLLVPDKATGGVLRVYYPIFPKKLFYATVTSATSDTVTMPASATVGSIVMVDDYYNGMFLTNDDGQYREITDYVGSTRVFTVDEAWSTNPTAASVMSLSSPIWPRFQKLIHQEAGIMARADVNMDIRDLAYLYKQGTDELEEILNKKVVQKSRQVRKIAR